jgi:hypothetical protein
MPDGRNMASTFNEILKGQSKQIAAASREDLAETARAYVAAAARR